MLKAAEASFWLFPGLSSICLRWTIWPRNSTLTKLCSKCYSRRTGLFSDLTRTLFYLGSVVAVFNGPNDFHLFERRRISKRFAEKEKASFSCALILLSLGWLFEVSFVVVVKMTDSLPAAVCGSHQQSLWNAFQRQKILCGCAKWKWTWCEDIKTSYCGVLWLTCS